MREIMNSRAFQTYEQHNIELALTQKFFTSNSLTANNIIHRLHSTEITHLITYAFRLNFIDNRFFSIRGTSANRETISCL